MQTERIDHTPTPIETRPRVVLVNRCVVINDEGKFLLLKRIAGDIWAPNLWEFPGGKLDEGQTISDALEREVWEEARIQILPLTRANFVQDELLKNGKYAGLPYIELVGIARAQGNRVKLSHEHQNFKWVTLDEAFELPLTEQCEKALSAMEEDLHKNMGVV